MTAWLHARCGTRGSSAEEPKIAVLLGHQAVVRQMLVVIVDRVERIVRDQTKHRVGTSKVKLLEPAVDPRVGEWSKIGNHEGPAVAQLQRQVLHDLGHQLRIEDIQKEVCNHDIVVPVASMFHDIAADDLDVIKNSGALEAHDGPVEHCLR